MENLARLPVKRPVKRRTMNTKEACGILYGVAILVDQVPGVLDLRRGQGRTWPELYPECLGRDAAVPGAANDERALELGDAGEQGQHHAPGRRRRVGPRLGQAAQAGAGLLDALGNAPQVARAARQAVQPGDCHHVAGAQVIEHPGQLNPVAPGAGDFL